MKKIFLSIYLMFISVLAYSQEVNNRKNHPDVPMIFIPKNHDPNYFKSHQLPSKSFYESRSDWQHIIDSTWGPGESLSRKLLIFNTYAQKVHDEFDGFLSLNLNYDSLFNLYLDKINTSTSKGAFSSIMSHFAYDLKDLHTSAYDKVVVETPLNPGVPVLLVGSFISVEHFGAVTTVLPDSSTMILRVVPNHPLNLEPGDRILGYEGVPWKYLVQELFNAGLPMLVSTGGCKSADTYHNLIGAGLNWHLFSTIDILKYSSGDTLHLSVQSLLNLNLPLMLNNEQLTIPNIPFPKLKTPPLDPDTVVTYGILDNTNIGYIYLALEYPENTADEQFYEAIKALKNTDALIIDMRFNGGGWALFDSAFALLFKENHKTIEDAHRCNSITYDLCPGGNWNLYQVDGMPPDNYDRPIAVLLGPTCVSMGDLTAQRLRYHPMIRFFGTSSNATLGDNRLIGDFPGWYIRYSFGDMFHTSEPGIYLNRREFPIDFPVWHNTDDVANGRDAVVEKSLDWINNLVYAHDVTTDKWWYTPGKDTVTVTAIIENPNLHQVSSRLYFESLDGSVNDSTDMAEIGLPGSKQWLGTWITPGTAENTYWISLKVTDNTTGTYFTSQHASQITNVPLIIDSLSIKSYSNFRFSIKPFLTNEGTTQILNDLSIKITSIDSWVTSVIPPLNTCPELAPGQTKAITTLPIVSYDLATFPGYFNFTFSVSSGGWPYWIFDTTLTITPHGLDEELHSLDHSLNQNYPNPFYPSTNISFSISSQSFVSLKIFDLRGVEVATLVSEELSAGDYIRKWNAKNMPCGIYFYRLQAGVFAETKKLVLLKK